MPLSSVTDHGSVFFLPRFGTYNYEKEAGKKKEKIKYWVSNLSKVKSSDIEQVLNTQQSKELNPSDIIIK